jgi:hypothetical protein
MYMAFLIDVDPVDRSCWHTPPSPQPYNAWHVNRVTGSHHVEVEMMSADGLVSAPPPLHCRRAPIFISIFLHIGKLEEIAHIHYDKHKSAGGNVWVTPRNNSGKIKCQSRSFRVRYALQGTYHANNVPTCIPLEAVSKC